MAVTTALKQLYEIDDVQWLEETVGRLKARQFDHLDLENLIEELEDLGSEKKNAVSSLLEQLIRHLLLLEFWEMERENNIGHWQAEIVSFRTQLRRRLTTNLRNYLSQELLSIYGDALVYVKIKTRFKVDFPVNCPYTLEQLLDTDWVIKI
ncbi:MAG: DUF29 domain-containing protein [Woronichinia naegeliana WA131]|jgi:hypothetical protein|uniref:DUF29 domain-containing protein n=1 Tax=Woronichinia naegeliana WA131 TaxID=2824559 RepID=A0A977KU66_9CYAN|nr:MAG: DUF29 domain-containing protein [Woronichinia naegeliana WA131]